MCKKKKMPEVVEEQQAVNPIDTFELKKPEIAYDENGNRDYFTEYYNAYKNDYIDQYLAAYKKFKEEGNLDNYAPVNEDAGNEDNLSDLDE